ncbi:hypothetical protein LCGC14_1827120 [marine sediment metagenome]|uniref:Uncharacterized protein n=1 Tax=marine sediment metagenome TaxID=412755 RepID=A0A0F9H5B0_9ZZZZ
MKKIYHPCKNCHGYGSIFIKGTHIITYDDLRAAFANEKKKCPACDGTGGSPRIAFIIED